MLGFIYTERMICKPSITFDWCVSCPMLLPEQFLPGSLLYASDFTHNTGSTHSCQEVQWVNRDLQLKYDHRKGYGVYYSPGTYSHSASPDSLIPQVTADPRLIPRGTVLFPYLGEYISTAETHRRQTAYDRLGINYILTTVEHYSSSTSSSSSTGESSPGGCGRTVVLRSNIDATNYGNTARFLNHSCDPSCVLVMCRRGPGSGDILGLPLVTTRREILPGEELTFNYHDSMGLHTGESPGDKSVVDQAESGGRKRPWLGRRKCHCNSSNCVGVLM